MSIYAEAKAPPARKSNQRSPVYESKEWLHSVLASAAATCSATTSSWSQRRTTSRTTFLRRQSLTGRVTSVGDGDNFRIYRTLPVVHGEDGAGAYGVIDTPGGRLLGWDWLRRIPAARKDLKDQTVHVRLAGSMPPSECISGIRRSRTALRRWRG